MLGLITLLWPDRIHLRILITAVTGSQPFFIEQPWMMKMKKTRLLMS